MFHDETSEFTAQISLFERLLKNQPERFMDEVIYSFYSEHGHEPFTESEYIQAEAIFFARSSRGLQWFMKGKGVITP